MDTRGMERAMEPVRALRDALDEVIATHEEYRAGARRARAARRALDAYREALGPQLGGEGLLDTLQGEVERAEAGLEELRIRHCRARRQAEEHGDRIRWDSLGPLDDGAPGTPACGPEEPSVPPTAGAPTGGRSRASEASGDPSAAPETGEGGSSEAGGSPIEGPAGDQVDGDSLWAEILREEADEAGFQAGAAPKP